METTAQPADRRSDELGKWGEDLAADYEDMAMRMVSLSPDLRLQGSGEGRSAR